MNSQNQICNQKNCACGKQHAYVDEFTNLAKTNEGHARELFQEKRDELKKQVEVFDMKRKPMAHLHLHSFFSILDGCGSIDNYVKLAREYNHPAMAITDHGSVAGTFEFWKKCKASGIKPIIGMEAYLNDKMGDFEDEKKHEGGANHQSIFVMNHQGYVNLNHLVYRSFTEGFYRRGRIKTEWLIDNKTGLFLTTSCAASHMANLVVKQKKEAEAEEYLKILMREFGDNLVAELQFNEYLDQKIYNQWLIRMIKKYSLMPILTNDVHYAFPDEAVLQDTLIAINQQSQLGEKAFKLSTRHLFYASADDFHIFNKKFGFNYPDEFVNMCLDNTLKVAEKCSFDFDTKTEKFPKYEASPEVLESFKTTDTKQIITRLAFFKLRQRIKDYQENKIVDMTPEKIKEYEDRLRFELEVIEEKQCLDYFMVYWELIRDYTSKGYSIGPGRGSSGGCLLAWCLGIIDIDPIRFDLYFERFMNPTRKCLTENNYVLLNNGKHKRIDKVVVGDKVFAETGAANVLEVIKRKIEVGEEIFNIETEDGSVVEVTGNHIIPVFRDGKRIEVRADQILETDYLFTF